MKASRSDRCTAASAGRIFAWLAIVAPALLFVPAAAAQAWRPDSFVQIVVGAGAGGGNDNTARNVQKILVERKLVLAPVNVVNKPGAGGAIAFMYLNQHAGDGNYLGVTSNTLLTNNITKRSPLNHNHFTPLAILINEYMAFSVKADSPLKTGKDLAERLRSDPGSVVLAISSVLGNINHIAFATVARELKVDPKRVKTVVFKSSGASLTALLGGHVDLVVGPTSIASRHMESGQLRVLAVTSPKRRPGVFANTPTWKELGVDAVIDNWRGVIGPKGMTPAQVAFWNNAFGKLFQTDEWKKDVERNYWDSAALLSADSAKYLDAQYDELKRALIELDMAK